MSETCNHNCESCSSDCKEPKSLLEEANINSKIKKVIAIVSGKGGVGKSLVTSLLTAKMCKKGYDTAILDADITGPSIPKVFGVKEEIVGDESGMFPAISKCGTKMMSVNLLLEKESDPVIWRGPVVAGTVKQFWSEVNWGDVDYMFVDMPPGTGDVPLTVFQSIPVDGIIIVTSPQELVSMIVEKAVKMAEMMNIPILGLVENLSYYVCTDCGKKHSIFGESHVEDVAKKYGISHIAKLPIQTEVAKKCDAGLVEDVEEEELNELCSYLETL